MSELKILHVIPNLLVGGAQRLVLDICNELNRRENIKVKLVIFDEKNEFELISEGLDIEVCKASVMPSISKKTSVNIEEYENIVDQFSPDIIHSHLYLAEIVTRENSRPNIKYFSHGHDNMIQLNNAGISTFFSKKKLTDYYEKGRLLGKYKKGDNTFIAISKDTQDYFNKTLPNSLNKNVVLLHNAIDTKRFTNNSENELDKEIRLINVGNLLDKKNQIFLLDVVKYLLDNHVKVKLSLVGDGGNKQLLENKIEELKLQDNVQMLGAVDNVEEYLWSSDVYVHSALYEPFGLVLLEAMAAGLPVVSLNGRGNSDIIADGDNGFLIEEQNAPIFGNRIIELMNNSALYQEIVHSGKKFSEKFDIKNYTDKLLRIYNKEY